MVKMMTLCMMLALVAEENLEVVQMDAKKWLKNHSADGDVDVLCVDLYDQDAESPVYDDVDFYSHCRSLLSHAGIMGVNLFGKHASFQHSAKQLAQVFDDGCLWSMQPTREGNTILFGTRQAVEWPDRQILLDRAETIENTWKLPARRWLKMLKPFEFK